MREILFRGKRNDNGKWVYSMTISKHYYNDNEIFSYYIGAGGTTIDGQTLGQFTGLTDKNGTKIFEGDIVRHFNNSDEEYDIGVVYFDTTLLGWRRTTEGRFHRIRLGTYKLNPTCIYEVIGNIHDNPELLKPSFKPEYRDGDPDCPICPNCRTPLNEMEDCDCGVKIDIPVYVTGKVSVGGLPTYEEARQEMIDAWNRSADNG